MISAYWINIINKFWTKAGQEVLPALSWNKNFDSFGSRDTPNIDPTENVYTKNQVMNSKAVPQKELSVIPNKKFRTIKAIPASMH